MVNPDLLSLTCIADKDNRWCFNVMAVHSGTALHGVLAKTLMS